MHVVHTIEALRELRKTLGRVAFVPTMGALHQGHLSLMKHGKSQADAVIVSIFVNPTQFGPNEDFDQYPRQLEQDLAQCRSIGVDVVFAPSVSEMYPEGLAHSTFVDVIGLTDHLCGKSRPGHFRGVTTIVTKLFNAVQPDIAVFGQKDYQQAAVIRRMTRELLMPIEIIAAPTAREPDGLAMSSRNFNLTPQTWAEARLLSQGLAAGWRAFRDGERQGRAIQDLVYNELTAALSSTSRIDYVECVDPDTLEPLGTITGSAMLCLAAHVAEVRLIDNLRLDDELPPELESVT